MVDLVQLLILLPIFGGLMALGWWFGMDGERDRIDGELDKMYWIEDAVTAEQMLQRARYAVRPRERAKWVKDDFDVPLPDDIHERRM